MRSSRFLSLLPALMFSVSVEALTAGVDYQAVVTDAGLGAYEAFPDVVRLQDGRLMAVFYAGYGHVSVPDTQLPDGGAIYQAFSTDGGLNWSPARELYDGPEDDRDPSIAQLDDGTLINNFFKSPSGNVYLNVADSPGASWSSPQFIVSSYATSSPVRQLSTGRLVVPSYRSVSLSDDQGQTWRHVVIPSAEPSAIGTGLTETDVIERSNGDLYAIHRADGSPMRYTISTDGGDTWGDTYSLGFQGHAPYLFKADGGAFVMAYRDMDLGGTRMRVSLDEGQTWGAPVLVDTVGGAYASLATRNDGSIGIVYYEEGAGSDIRMRRFTLNSSGNVQFLSMEKSVDDTTLYHELFSRPLLTTPDLEDYGWKFVRHASGTTMTQDTHPGLIKRQWSGGASNGEGSVNSNPLTVDTSYISGFFSVDAGIGPTHTLIYTDEYAIDRSAWTDLTFSWRNAGDFGNEGYRVAVLIGGQWYATDSELSAVTPNDWDLGWVIFEAGSAQWALLDLADLTLATESGALPSGDVVAFGLLNRDQAAPLRIDNFRVGAVAVPEPAMGAVVVCVLLILSPRMTRS